MMDKESKQELKNFVAKLKGNLSQEDRKGKEPKTSPAPKAFTECFAQEETGSLSTSTILVAQKSNGRKSGKKSKRANVEEGKEEERTLFCGEVLGSEGDNKRDGTKIVCFVAIFVLRSLASVHGLDNPVDKLPCRIFGFQEYGHFCIWLCEDSKLRH